MFITETYFLLARLNDAGMMTEVYQENGKK